MRAKLLLVEDDRSLGETLQERLEKKDTRFFGLSLRFLRKNWSRTKDLI